MNTAEDFEVKVVLQKVVVVASGFHHVIIALC